MCIVILLALICISAAFPISNHSRTFILPQCDNQCAKTCKASGTTWHMRCGWARFATFSKDGQSIANTSALTASSMTIRRKVRHDGDLQVLEILDVQAIYHSGEYRCQGVDELRTKVWTKCECLVVTAQQQEHQQCLAATRPKIYPPGPRNVRGIEGQPSLVLDCFSKGGATHFRRWLSNGTLIPNANPWSNTYVLRNVTRTMAGQYRCELLEKHKREYYDRVDYFVTIQQAVLPEAPSKPEARPGYKIVNIEQNREPKTHLIFQSTFRHGRMSLAVNHLVERLASRADPKQDLTPSEVSSRLPYMSSFLMLFVDRKVD
ncbi:uncharacterized protein LOC135812003 isoform X1 [Sycon ciliatum]|uniref:uncharacterized protein LOC135812003 isoform X1 n=1 Tax=Sycon ciliatum TaxID=27933 RepID=UPI0031F6301D